MALQNSLENKNVSLLDILDVILDKGVAIRGDLVISIADIDLVYLDLRVLISAVESLMEKSDSANKRGDAWGDDIEPTRAPSISQSRRTYST